MLPLKCTILCFQIDKYENWFVKAHTQEILRMESNKLQTTLYDMSKRRIGIGTGAFHIDEGFIANVCHKSDLWKNENLPPRSKPKQQCHMVTHLLIDAYILLTYNMLHSNRSCSLEKGLGWSFYFLIKSQILKVRKIFVNNIFYF